jgi:hypothetical protein
MSNGNALAVVLSLAAVGGVAYLAFRDDEPEASPRTTPRPRTRPRVPVPPDPLTLPPEIVGSPAYPTWTPPPVYASQWPIPGGVQVSYNGANYWCPPGYTFDGNDGMCYWTDTQTAGAKTGACCDSCDNGGPCTGCNNG